MRSVRNARLRAMRYIHGMNESGSANRRRSRKTSIHTCLPRRHPPGAHLPASSPETREPWLEFGDKLRERAAVADLATNDQHLEIKPIRPVSHWAPTRPTKINRQINRCIWNGKSSDQFVIGEDNRYARRPQPSGQTRVPHFSFSRYSDRSRRSRGGRVGMRVFAVDIHLADIIYRANPHPALSRRTGRG